MDAKQLLMSVKDGRGEAAVALVGHCCSENQKTQNV